MEAIEMNSVEISKIHVNGGTQARAALDESKVEEYRQLIEEANPRAWPFKDPIDVFYDGSGYWLADGFHRVAACQKAKLWIAEANIHQGTRRDAVLFACGANATHGLPRSAADKRRAVETLLNDEEWGQWSDREIARRCQVSNRFVSNLRKSLSVNGSQIEKKVIRGGTEYTMNTANIGTAAPQPTEAYILKTAVRGFIEQFGGERGQWLNYARGLRILIPDELRQRLEKYTYTQDALDAALEAIIEEEKGRVVTDFTVPPGAQNPTIREHLERWARSLTESYESVIICLANKNASGHDYKMGLAAEALGASEMSILHQAMALRNALPSANPQAHVLNKEQYQGETVPNPSVFAAVRQLRELGYTVEGSKGTDEPLRWSIDGGAWLEHGQVWEFLESQKEKSRPLAEWEMRPAVIAWLYKNGGVELHKRLFLASLAQTEPAYQLSLERHILDAYADTSPIPTVDSDALQQILATIAEGLQAQKAEQDAAALALDEFEAIRELRLYLEETGLEIGRMQAKYPDYEIVTAAAAAVLSSITLSVRELKRAIRHDGKLEDEEE